jgi:hypothetical protein
VIIEGRAHLPRMPDVLGHRRLGGKPLVRVRLEES